MNVKVINPILTNLTNRGLGSCLDNYKMAQIVWVFFFSWWLKHHLLTYLWRHTPQPEPSKVTAARQMGRTLSAVP